MANNEAKEAEKEQIEEEKTQQLESIINDGEDQESLEEEFEEEQEEEQEEDDSDAEFRDLEEEVAQLEKTLQGLRDKETMLQNNKIATISDLKQQSDAVKYFLLKFTDKQFF